MEMKYEIVKVTPTRRQTEQLHPNVEYQIHGFAKKDGRWLLASKENIVRNQKLDTRLTDIFLKKYGEGIEKIEKDLRELKKEHDLLGLKLKEVM